MKNIKHIAIIGAGIAGLALAIFARKQGIKVTIYERGKDFSSIGAGVTLWPNANFVIEQLGLMRDVNKAGGQPSFMRQLDQQDNIQNEFDISKLSSLCGFPTTNILRCDLVRILAKELEKLDATVYFDQTINTEDIPQLQKQFDLVVGCDGRMRSVAREYLYQNSAPAQYQGFINIIGISKMNLATFRHIIHDYRANNERFGIVPVTKQRCYWAAAWPCELDKSRPIEHWYDEMHLRFQHWPKKVQQVLKSYDQSSLKRLFVHDLDPLPRWHSGNLVIIGDAAHAPLPTSGQGASQTLEDAWHLSQRLNEDQPLDTVLKQFYESRIHKTTSTQHIGRRVAQQIFHQQPISPQTAPSISTEQLSQLYMQGLSKAKT